MLYNIFFANHGNGVGVEDQLSYIYDGLSSVNQRVLYSDQYYRDGINVILENNVGNFYKIISKMKGQYPESKLVFVATEVIKDGIFNSGNVDFDAEPSNEADKSHYHNRAYWQQRYDSFIELLPSIDRIICYSEQLMPEYQKLHKNVYYLPLAFPDNFVALKRKPLEDRKIDCLFTGSFANPYRKKIIQDIKGQGNLNVVVLPGNTPKYIRDEYFSRAKVAIGIKISERAGLLSKFRAFYCLTNEIEHLFEYPTDNTDLNEYLNFCKDNNKIVDELIQCVKNIDKFPTDIFDQYKNSKKLVYADIFNEMDKFIRA